MIWYSNKNNSQHLFTGINYNVYGPPPEFCWDLLCDDEPLVDDPESHSFNLDRRLSQLVKYAREQAEAYRTNNIALTMGEDFQYSVFDDEFSQKLFKYYKLSFIYMCVNTCNLYIFL